MPSLFSRARSNSKAQSLLSSHDASDEFGRVASSPIPSFADGSFLPLSLDRRQNEPQQRQNDYGFLSYERHVVLAPEQLARLVQVLVEELSSRGGITTPFIFSTIALDVSYSSIRRLLRAYLDTCDMRPTPSLEKAEAKWRDEARFAGLHELGMCLRWGLARVVRIHRGQEVRGLIPWDQYVRFRDSEAGALRVVPSPPRPADPNRSEPLSPSPLSDLFKRPHSHCADHRDNGPYVSNPPHRKQHLLGPHATLPLASIWSPLFRPRAHITIFSPHLSSLPPRNKCIGAPYPGLHSLARYPTDRRLCRTWRARPAEGLD